MSQWRTSRRISTEPSPSFNSARDIPYFSVAHAKKEAAILVDREIRAILNEPVERRFQDPITSCYQFIVKAPSGKHVLPPHQDLTAVMEPEERAAMVWIPMVDVDENSGAVGLVRGSHRFFDDVRCSPTLYNRQQLPYKDYAANLFPYMAFPKLRAGDAIVWDSAIIHGSRANRSPQLRIVAAVGLRSANTRYVLNYLLPGTNMTKFERFEIDTNFHVDNDERMLCSLFERGSRPEGLTSVGVFEHHVTKISFKEMIALIK